MKREHRPSNLERVGLDKNEPASFFQQSLEAMARVTSNEDSASQSSFTHFAQILSSGRGQDTSLLLDHNQGLAALFADACNERISLAGSGESSGRSVQAINKFSQAYEEDEKEEAIAWRLEEQTWRLVQLLHAERAQRSSQESSDNRSTRKDAYKTPFAAVQEIIEADATLAELRIVRDWLSSNLLCAHPVEVRKGYWPFTKNKLKADKRLLSTASSSNRATNSALSKRDGAANKKLRSLDPDAPTREGVALELEDSAYEKALSKTLFEYVRGGQLEDAIDLARSSDRSWRAASLRGANLYWRPNLADDEDEIRDKVTTPIGNRNRTLWKSVCRNLCAKTSLDEYEKALYGALSGDLKSVLHVSTTWEAHLWAHANARLENAIDVALDARGGWWGQGNAQTFGLSSGNRESGAVQLLDLSLSLNVGRKTGSKSSESATPPSVSLHDVFITLGQTQQNHIDTQANHPFRIVQRAVILSELPALLTHVESLLPSMRVTLAPQQYIRLARFFAHLVLYLRLIRWDAMPNDVVCNSILKQYVDVLEGVGEDELVALYASSLEAESAVESYAHFLKLMDANEGLESKRSALLRAQTHDLDIAAVAVATVGMIFDEYSSSFTPMTTFTELSTALTPAEDALIKGIDWLCIHPSTFADAVVHINVLMRLFLASGRLHAARKLLFDIPAEVMESVGQMEAQGDVEQQAIELVHWRTFFDALDRHLRFVEVWSRRPTRNARSELLNWTKGLDAIVDEARIAILQILQMDWIKFNFTTSAMLDAATEQRLSQLASIRQKYIPEMVTRLHTMLYDVHEVLPHTLAAVIQIPVLVADERHKLYLDFIGSSPDNRLQNFIQQIRLAQLAGLKSDPDPFHYASQTMV